MSKRSELLRKIAEQELAAAWPQWKIISILGRGTYGEVYQICKEEMGFSSYSALKIIRTDESYKTTSVIDGSNSSDSFQIFIDNAADEIHIMELLKGAPNIVIIDDYKVLNDNGECSVLIRMELLENITSLIKKRGELSLGSVLKIGIDICHALEYCERCHIIHRDIKESNLFYNQDLNTFKLGDFGVSRRMDSFGQKASMTGIGTISYMAPEVFKGESYDSTVDLYSLGIVLYTLLNQNRLPFTPLDKQELDAEDIQKANTFRLNGEELLAPVYADPELAKIVCKACSPKSQDRYQNARSFRQSLIKYINKLDKKLLSVSPQTAATLQTDNIENDTDNNSQNTSDSPTSNSKRRRFNLINLISGQINSYSKPVRVLFLIAAIWIIVILIFTKNAEKSPVAGGSFDLSHASATTDSKAAKAANHPATTSNPAEIDTALSENSNASVESKTATNDSSIADNSLSKPGESKPNLREYVDASSIAASETTTNVIKEEINPYNDQLVEKAYVCSLDLADGLNIGKYVIVKNNSHDVLDLRANFIFLNKKGHVVARDSYIDYAVAPGKNGIILQQSNLPGIEKINYSLTASKSDAIPVLDCIRWKVEDLKEDGIIVHVNNPSPHDIHDFRIRVLWFDEKKQLETVAFRWSNNTDHILRSGESCDLNFQRQWGKETYSVFFHGIVDN